MEQVKILCFYLPQFHETKENNEWWGKGYTDWEAAKKAVAYSRKQDQPRIPLDHRYYDLAEESGETWKWQAELANQYGIYGFCIYHYWFAGRRFLEKPVEILRNHKEIPIHYTLCWDSSTFKRTWYANQHEKEILIQQDYGDEKMWRRHFMDLLPDFRDDRYIKIDNRPAFHIYRARKIECLAEMRKCWDELAKKYGFDGIYLIVSDIENREDEKYQSLIDAYYNYEPVHSYHKNLNRYYGLKSIFMGGIKKRINRLFHTDFLPYVRDAKGIYRCILKEKNQSGKKTYYGMFADYDDTPRRQKNGIVYANNSVGLFEKALRGQLQKSKKEKNEFLYITAWNEWGESAYMEPDERNGYSYLECIQRVLQEENVYGN